MNVYQWHRFWCERIQTVALDQDGYLRDPSPIWGTSPNPEVEPVDLLTPTKCVVILGEPGIGKSRTLLSEQQRINHDYATHASVLINLQRITAPAELGQQLAEITSILDIGKIPVVLLDGVDECRVRIHAFHQEIIKSVQQFDGDAVLWRLSCRTSDWPKTLEVDLNSFFGNDQLAIRELLPLTRQDVMLAATTLSQNAAAFIDQVRLAGAGPLAARPVTLEMLMRIAESEGMLSSDRTHVYAKGCLALVEISEEWFDAGHQGELSDAQRLHIASRAASLLLTNQRGIWIGARESGAPNDCIRISELAGATASVEGTEFEITEAGVRESLKTGLFSARGDQTLGPAHQTIAEFLTAMLLLELGLTVDQLRTLLMHQEYPFGEVVPQLRGVATWLAALSPTWRRVLIDQDPELFLSADTGDYDVESARRLVDSLLVLGSSGRLYESYWGSDRQLSKLAYDGLADQLGPVISDKTLNDRVRSFAIHVAECCQVHAVEGQLLELAMDATEDHHLRAQAVGAFAAIADLAAKATLLELLNLSEDQDPDDEIKGEALQALWPHHLTVPELITQLVRPRNPGLFGSYRRFLNSDFMSSVTAAETPLVVDWATDQLRLSLSGHRPHFDYDKIVNGAWKLADDTRTASSLARLLVVSAQNGRHDIPNELEWAETGTRTEHDQRAARLVTKEAISILEDSYDVWEFARLGLIQRDDLSWTLEQYQNSSAERKALWLNLISRSMALTSAQDVELVRDAAAADPMIAEHFEFVLDPESFDKKRPPVRVKPEHVEHSVEQFAAEVLMELGRARKDGSEHDPIAHWNHLCRILAIQKRTDDHILKDDWALDLATTLTWQHLSDETRQVIVAVAQEFLEAAQPNQGLSLKPDSPEMRWVDLNAVKAIALIAGEWSNSETAISDQMLSEWGISVFVVCLRTWGEVPAPLIKILSRAQNLYPDAFGHAAIDYIESEAAKEGPSLYRLVSVMDEIWTSTSLELALQRLDEGDLPAQVEIDLALAITPYLSTELRSRLRTIGETRLNSGEVRTSALIFSALLERSTEEDRQRFFELLQTSDDFAKQLVPFLAGRHGGDELLASMSETELDTLYRWLVEKYPPPDEVPPMGEVYSPTPRMEIQRWRDDALNHLASKGTEVALELLRRIAADFPDNAERLGWIVDRAGNLTRAKTWKPPSALDLKELFRSTQTRLISSPAQLLEVVVESLLRYEEWLQRNEPPRVRTLWNEGFGNKGELSRPKDESELSDSIKDHLDRDLRNSGLIINREVSNRRGDENDIRVEIVERDRTGNKLETHRVVIEVKGSWHPEVYTSMRTQLIDRYMHDNDIDHGVHLVGWYRCDRWDPSDPKYDRHLNKVLDKAKEELRSQAERLSDDGRSVRSIVIDCRLKY